MAEGTCRIDGCDRLRYRRDYCASHYMKAYRHNDPEYQHAPTHVDLTSQRFGSLVAIQRLDGRAGKWLCRCDCGNTTTVRVGDLKRGSVRSCGERPTHPRRIAIGYAGAHDRIEATRGPAKHQRCTDCGQPAAHWSYDHADTDEQVEDSLPYSTDPSHYDPRCVPCHRRFDRSET